jgi:hypothetical protein
MKFYSAIRIMKFCHLQVNGWNWRTSPIILREVSPVQQDKGLMLSLICRNRANINISDIMKNRSC